ncbi:MAG: branched-chain amino acid ABC transporter permease, partial [Bradyrhizobium sp.]|uniref:branched-chain amino acid ABC transporter permease n=1 Tax=Bradyrhizobium sp. TaxID=376 RepID=UPI003C7B2F64
MIMLRMRSLLPPLLFTIAYAVVSLSVTNSYYQLILTLVPVWAVFGLSWNLLSGYTGLISFGHAAFFGIGAYATALGQIYFDLSPWLLIPVAAMLGGIAGLLIGFPTFRLQGHYFALAMLAYPLAILYVFEWLGFQEVTLPIKRDATIAYMQFADPRLYTLLALAILFAIIVLTQIIERSRFGMALLAIKQNEAAAEAAGIDTLIWKLRAITLSGAIAAAIGAFYAQVLLVVTPQSVFGMLVSAQALTVAMFGGVGTVWGPVIGAVILIPLAEILN